MGACGTSHPENHTTPRLSQKSDFDINFGRWRDIGGM